MTASDSPGRPKLLKGALAVYESSTTPGRPPDVIVFQYNPEQVRRTLANRTPPRPSGESAGQAREEVLRVVGPPLETVNLSVVLSAIDQVQIALNGGPSAEDGLHPALATLELLLYPPTDWLRDAEREAAQGEVSVAPADLPLVLLVWGRSRVVPVMLTSFTVTEEAFDVDLNPIEAKVDLGLRVLTSLELPPDSQGHNAFRAYHSAKESLAAAHEPGGDDARIRQFVTEAVR